MLGALITTTAVIFLLLVVVTMYAGYKAWGAYMEYNLRAKRLQRLQARLDALRRERLYTHIRGR